MLAEIRTALAARLDTATIEQVYLRPPEIPGSDVSAVIGAITWRATPGEREVTVFDAAVEVWVARRDDDSSAIAKAEAAVDEIRASLAGAVTLGGQVTHAFVVAGTGNTWVLVGGSEWLVTSLTVEITVRQSRGYAP